MQYKVLYRKYRPDDFDNLVGQEINSKILKSSVINNKISHAYIFTGPRGTGKTSSAKIYAKNINCLHPIDGNACNKCENCINYENSPDIIELDAASNNGVDEIREINNNIKLSPNSLKYKVYIIDEVHMLTPGAFNALLLTLEEPPKHAVFILATTNIESVPITILSRCQRFDFKRVMTKDIVPRLKYICEREGIEITNEALEIIGELSDGGVRDALSLLDQLSKEGILIDEKLVSNYSGNVSKLVINNVLNYIDENNYEELDKLMIELANCNVNYKLLIKNLISGCVNRVKDIISSNYKSRLSIEEYKSLVIELTDLQNKINVNVDVYSLVFLVLVSYINLVETPVINLISNKSFKEKEETHENVLYENVTDKDNGNEINLQKKKYDEILINNCFVKASKEEKNIVSDKWGNFINNLDIKLKSLLLDTKIAMASKDIILVIVSRDNILKELYSNFNYENLYNKEFNEDCKIVYIDNNYWLNLIDKYKKDRQSGIIYEEIDVSIYKSYADVDVSDIFDIDKIEEG